MGRSMLDNRPSPLIECYQVHDGGSACVDADINISATFNMGQHTHVHIHLTITDNGKGLLGTLKMLLGRGKSQAAIVSPSQAIELIESSMKEVKKDAERQTPNVSALSTGD